MFIQIPLILIILLKVLLNKFRQQQQFALLIHNMHLNTNLFHQEKMSRLFGLRVKRISMISLTFNYTLMNNKSQTNFSNW